jgi:hypothetical protein
LKYCSEDKLHHAGAYLSQQTVGRSVKMVFIMSWDSSIGHCWFLFTLHWPFIWQSSLFSCDLQPRVYVARHLLGSSLANQYTRHKGSVYWEMFIHLQFYELSVFSLCTFVSIKIHMDWGTWVNHDPNSLGSNKVITSTLHCGNCKMSLQNQSTSRSSFYPLHLGCVQILKCNMLLSINPVPTPVESVIWGHQAVTIKKPWAGFLALRSMTMF